jgi:hypothetical protein
MYSVAAGADRNASYQYISIVCRQYLSLTYGDGTWQNRQSVLRNLKSAICCGSSKIFLATVQTPNQGILIFFHVQTVRRDPRARRKKTFAKTTKDLIEHQSEIGITHLRQPGPFQRYILLSSLQ